MALTKATLKDAILSSLEGYPSSADAASQGWSDAIAEHVSTGQSPQGVPPTPASVSAGKGALSSGIASAFQSGSGSGAASGLSAAVVTFYQGLLFTGATPGVVSSVGGGGVLSSAMAAAFSENTSTAATMAQAADRFADAIHACAQTVIVTHAPPSAVTGALT